MTMTHIDTEAPKFKGKPHAWVQWKGTDVCADIHCSCGHHSHFDGDFMYYVRCPNCKKVWEVGTHIKLYEPVPGSYNVENVKEAD